MRWKIALAPHGYESSRCLAHILEDRALAQVAEHLIAHTHDSVLYSWTLARVVQHQECFAYHLILVKGSVHGIDG